MMGGDNLSKTDLQKSSKSNASTIESSTESSEQLATLPAPQYMPELEEVTEESVQADQLGEIETAPVDNPAPPIVPEQEATEDDLPAEQEHDVEVAPPDDPPQPPHHNGTKAYTIKSTKVLERRDKTFSHYTRSLAPSNLAKSTSIRVEADNNRFPKYHRITEIDGAPVRRSNLYIKKSSIILLGLDAQDIEQLKSAEDTTGMEGSTLEAAEKIKATYDNMIGNDGVSGVVDNLSKTKLGNEEGNIRALTSQDSEYNVENMQHATNMAYIGDSAAAVFGAVNLISNILKEGDNAWESYEHFLDGFHGLAKISEGANKVIGAATGNSDVSNAGVLSEMVTHEIGAVKGAFLIVKKAYGLAKNHSEMNKKEKAAVGLEMIQDALGLAQEAMYMTKNIQEVMFNGVMSATVMQSIPAIGIAINAVDLIRQTYYLIQSIVNKHHIQKHRNEVAAEYDLMDNDPEAGKELVKPAEKKQKKLESLLANLIYVRDAEEHQIEKEEITPEELHQYKLDIQLFKYSALPASFFAQYRKAKKKVKLHGKQAVTFQAKKERLQSIKDRIVTTKEELAEHDDQTRLDYGDSFQDYGMMKELNKINEKRITRSLIHVGTDLVSITGDVLTLTGVGAMAGGITKGVGAGVEAATFVTRVSKQSFNDKGARQQIKEKDTFHSRTADQTKSKPAKQARRKKHAIRILQLIKNIDFEGDAETAAQQLTIAKLYLHTAGAQTKKLSSLKSGVEMVQYISESMAQREI